MKVTTKNLAQASDVCVAIDQRKALVPGCETWPIFYEPGRQRGQMSVWPEDGRAAVAWGGDSQWGDWMDRTRTLILDTGEIIDDTGEVVEAAE